MHQRLPVSPESLDHKKSGVPEAAAVTAVLGTLVKSAQRNRRQYATAYPELWTTPTPISRAAGAESATGYPPALNDQILQDTEADAAFAYEDRHEPSQKSINVELDNQPELTQNGVLPVNGGASIPARAGPEMRDVDRGSSSSSIVVWYSLASVTNNHEPSMPQQIPALLHDVNDSNHALRHYSTEAPGPEARRDAPPRAPRDGQRLSGPSADAVCSHNAMLYFVSK